MAISIDQRTAILEHPAVQPPGVFQIARISLTIKGQKSPGHPTFTGVVSAGAIG